MFGHQWQEEPWQNDSTRIGDNPKSQVMGGMFLGPSHALNLVVDRAGAPGDYLYRNSVATPGNYAMWGVFRVAPAATDVLALTAYQRDGSGTTLSGYVTPDLRTQRYAPQVMLIGRPDRASVDQTTGRFLFALKDATAIVTARSANGGEASAALPSLVPAAPAALAANAPSVGLRAKASSQAIGAQQQMSLVKKYLPRVIDQRRPPP